MTGLSEELERARAAKTKAKSLLAKIPEINGIGLTQIDGEYAVKINLSCEPADRSAIPDEIDGIPVVLHVVGEIHKQ